MRLSRPRLIAALALVLCAVVPSVIACSPSGTGAPPPTAEPQAQPVAPAPSDGIQGAATPEPTPPGIKNTGDGGMWVVGYLLPREGEWTVYDADPGSDEGSGASPLAALVPGNVDQAGIEAFSGRYISAAGASTPGDDVQQIRVDTIEAAVEP